MKRSFVYLVIIILTVCLVSAAYERFVPVTPVQAASEPHPILNGNSHPEKEDAQKAQPVVFVVSGLVCALFVIIAVSPLLVEDPT